VYVEHNAPQGRIAELRHPVADRTDVVVAHVTHFNDLFWDSGRAPTTVVEHGVVDPGWRYSGDVARAAVVVNEPCRRGRVVGTDLLDRFRAAGPLDVYGMETEPVGGRGEVPQDALHAELARRRVYLHPFRWTSLGLSLVEAMLLGMPVVALGTTAVREAVPVGAGVVSTRLDTLQAALRSYLADADAARAAGAVGRAHASRTFALDRFLDDWDRLLVEVVR
jgi:glycosyltransferase involved in cell wall biosynthesis